MANISCPNLPKDHILATTLKGDLVYSTAGRLLIEEDSKTLDRTLFPVTWERVKVLEQVGNRNYIQKVICKQTGTACYVDRSRIDSPVTLFYDDPECKSESFVTLKSIVDLRQHARSRIKLLDVAPYQQIANGKANNQVADHVISEEALSILSYLRAGVPNRNQGISIVIYDDWHKEWSPTYGGRQHCWDKYYLSIANYKPWYEIIFSSGPNCVDEGELLRRKIFDSRFPESALYRDIKIMISKLIQNKNVELSCSPENTGKPDVWEVCGAYRYLYSQNIKNGVFRGELTPFLTYDLYDGVYIPSDYSAEKATDEFFNTTFKSLVINNA